VKPSGNGQDLAASQPEAPEGVPPRMSGDEDKDMLAAEYVVGTLTADERQAVAARRLHETDLDAAIIAWEARLSAWLSEYEPVAPPPDLRAAIINRIDRSDIRTRLLSDEPVKLAYRRDRRLRARSEPDWVHGVSGSPGRSVDRALRCCFPKQRRAARIHHDH